MEAAKAECCQQLLQHSPSVSNKTKRVYLRPTPTLGHQTHLYACKIVLSFYRGRIKSVYNLLGNNFHVICGGNHFNFITDHCVKFKGSVIALVVILIHEFRMETFKKPKKKVYSKREVFFPPMMYIYYLYMFFMISFIYLKSHALR